MSGDKTTYFPVQSALVEMVVVGEFDEEHLCEPLVRRELIAETDCLSTLRSIIVCDIGTWNRIDYLLRCQSSHTHLRYRRAWLYRSTTLSSSVHIMKEQNTSDRLLRMI